MKNFEKLWERSTGMIIKKLSQNRTKLREIFSKGGNNWKRPVMGLFDYQNLNNWCKCYNYKISIGSLMLLDITFNNIMGFNTEAPVTRFWLKRINISKYHRNIG